MDAHPIYDLRSDTVTRPTPAMRAAMLAAEVDDAAYGDDPVVCALEAEVAALLGKPAAIWVPTGTMANQIGVAVHTRRGDTLACVPGAHVRIHEDASAAALWGVQAMPIGDRRGFTVHALAALLDEVACGWPPIGLVWLENTLGEAGGAIWPLTGCHDGRDGLSEVAAFARAQGCAVHLDGARLWNAHVATGIGMDRWAQAGDTVSVSLSKGLGAPAGSLLAGSTEIIARARRLAHGLGGAMRQAPAMLAAAGRYALAHHIDRLADDHRRARRLAAGIADLPHWDVPEPETNLICCRVRAPIERAELLCVALRAAGIRCNPNIAREVRLAVHLDLDDTAIDAVIERVHHTLGSDPGRFAPITS